MGDQLTIKQIRLVSGLGLFRQYEPSGDLPPFRKANLIYGFNGSGKTTLSRLFCCLETGERHEEFEETVKFQIELSDGSVISSESNFDQLKGRLLVFNDDFVRRNLRWSDATASPIFYIGKDQAEASAKLEEVRRDLQSHKERLAMAESNRNAKRRQFDDLRRDIARVIAEALDLGRRYNAANLDVDFGERRYDGAEIEDDELLALQRQMRESAPLPKIDISRISIPSLQGLTQRATTVLQQTPGSVAVEALLRHSSMLGWAEEGLHYHVEHNLRECLFCGNGLVDERLSLLKASVEGRFSELQSDVRACIDEVEQVKSQVLEVFQSFPQSSRDIAPTLVSDFNAASAALSSITSQLVTHLNALGSLLLEKSKDVNASVEWGATIENLLKVSQEFSSVVKKASDLIAQHNEIHDNFLVVREEAKRKVKEHLLAENQVRYDEVASSFKGAESQVRELQDRVVALEAEEKDLVRRIQTHGPAAEAINRLLCGYLGRDNLRVEVDGEGFRIFRDGRPVSKGPLSEGEKTAIALCYFLSKFGEGGRNITDLIVVIDDPISSLDTKALNYCLSMLKGLLGRVCQFILMTHNLSFMLAAKRWLFSRTEYAPSLRDLPENEKAQKASATLFFLETFSSAAQVGRQTRLVPLNKLLRDYESEYHYLFALVHRFHQQQQDVPDFLLMPNVMRKVLELFLAFKKPGSAGLTSKVEALAQAGVIEGPRLLALERLVQLESHADNLDDFLEHSSLTVEETRDAAAALMSLIEVIDQDHYRAMCRLVQ